MGGLWSSSSTSQASLTRGQKYAEAKVVRLERGQTDLLEIKKVKLFDGASEVIAAYLKTEACACTTLVLQENEFTTKAFQKLAPCFASNSSVTEFQYVRNPVREATVVDEQKRQAVLEAASTVLDGGADASAQDGAVLFAEALEKNTALATLSFEETGLGDEGCTSLARALERNATLRKLGLPRNGIGFLGCQSLADALRSNSSCTSLDLDENAVGSEGFFALLKGVAVQGRVTELNLRANRVVGRDIDAQVADVLAANTCLLALDLRRNALRDAGAELIAQALASNVTLARLYLSSNEIRAAGAEALAAALEQNSALEELYLDVNEIGDEPCVRLARAIATPGALRKLDLRINEFTGPGYEALADAVQKNGALRSLELSESHAASRGPVARIKEKLGKNAGVSADD
eukprot:TRINITY_DN30521_c0_g1_i1.p1 TRINITY_DN30521_c0_g1~~TRINITY_DN30521_c0_g1_i1.p1  ORF type:complete len:407 (-),score=124.92 TRINITY_DN30521_c0_g1_i1:97-1317(-)